MITDKGRVPLKRQLFLGLTGDDVSERQGLLNALTDVAGPMGQSNLPEISEVGVFGTQTLARVKEFQMKNRLTVDGVIGQETDSRMDDLWALHMALMASVASKD